MAINDFENFVKECFDSSEILEYNGLYSVFWKPHEPFYDENAKCILCNKGIEDHESKIAIGYCVLDASSEPKVRDELDSIAEAIAAKGYLFHTFVQAEKPAPSGRGETQDENQSS